jgi:Tfp pilus assembly protein PilF
MGIEGYWIRHQFYLRKNLLEQAFKDLNSVTEIHKKHYGALLSKAFLYQRTGISFFFFLK